MLENAYKGGLYLRARLVRGRKRECVQESEEKEKRKGCCPQLHRQQRCELSDEILLHVLCCNTFSISNNIVSPVDVDGFYEPR